MMKLTRPFVFHASDGSHGFEYLNDLEVWLKLMETYRSVYDARLHLHHISTRPGGTVSVTNGSISKRTFEEIDL